MTDHSALSVADYIINKASEDNKTFTPLQLIKLVYLCHGWMLGLYGRPLLNEPIKAWRYGPVIAELYDEVKKYRSEPVPDNLSTAKVVFDDEETDLMNQVVDIYSNYSGIEPDFDGSGLNLSENSL